MKAHEQLESIRLHIRNLTKEANDLITSVAPKIKERADYYWLEKLEEIVGKDGPMSHTVSELKQELADISDAIWKRAVGVEADAPKNAQAESLDEDYWLHQPE